MDDGTTSDDQAHGQAREGQRIAKVMARAGLCSRREAEGWVEAGRVTVNGEVLTSPAYNVSEADDVLVDEKPLAARERTRLFLFHKPRGLVTTARDPEGRHTIFDALPPDLPRVVAVGRLDINTEGLLLLTNDGGLARVLELPSTGWLRRYRVRAHGTVEQESLDALRQGVTVGGVDYAGIDAKLDREQGSNAWITMGLREGKNREIKRVVEHLGLIVNRLIRVSFGPFELGDLPDGEVMEVRTRVLKDQLGVKLAKEAGVDLDAPIAEREPPPPPPARRESGARRRPPDRARGARDGRTSSDAGRAKRFVREESERRGPPPPSTPVRRRKHVSALRAEIAADSASADAPRKRVERGATQDRKGRTIAVERISQARESSVEEKPGGREPGARGETGREPLERVRRPSPYDSKAVRDGKGRSRPRGEVHEGPPRERGFDRPEGERGGRHSSGAGAPRQKSWRDEGKREGVASGRPRHEGADRPPRERSFERKGPPRERSFDRPEGERGERRGSAAGAPRQKSWRDDGKREGAALARPRREDAERPPRERSYEKKGPPRQKRFDRPASAGRAGGGPPGRGPGKPSGKGLGGPRRPPRKS